jgi:uncharacterized membrane protein
VTLRRPYLDWLRGVAVLIMIEGHTLDSWTRVQDRDRGVYDAAIFIAGFGAPIFLFLAGVTLGLAAGSRLRNGTVRPKVAGAAFRRGLWVLGLAFLFRVQSWLISGGAFPESLLKVDILNVMGVSMMLTAVLWGAGWNRASRTALFAAGTILLAMLTPPVRAASSLAVLPDPIEWYLRPGQGMTTFALFPWAGFLTAGAAVGTWLDCAREPLKERRINALLLLIGVGVGLAGYAAAFLPPIFPETTFWTGSPTFFFVRIGVLMTVVPVAYRGIRDWRHSWLQEFGRSSLFVYWIHVEMVYGVLSFPLHRRLPLEASLGALALFTAFLFALVRLKKRLGSRGQSPEVQISGNSPIPPTPSGLA